MKAKVIIAVEFVIIVVLLIVLSTQFISFKTIRPVVREPAAISESEVSYTPPPPPRMDLETVRKARALRAEFSPKIDKITDEIYLARGFSLGSSIMVITEEGLVIIDTTGNAQVAEKILSEFRKITDKPIRYIIYTHGHPDHIYGAHVFMAEGVQVIATRAAVEFMKRQDQWLGAYHLRSRTIQAGRAALEFATKTVFSSPFPPWQNKQMIWPTITFEDEYVFKLGGKRFELYHAMGETPGHLMVWMPGERALFPGDLYYASFPNLSTPMLESRPVKEWYESLDRMVALNPDYVIPGHTRALSGREETVDVLSHHSQAIRYVYDETLKAINAGKTLDEAAHTITLPERLAKRWHLQELYGRVDWSVRGIYRKETGWYDGHGTGLNPLPPGHRAREMVQLAEGADKILVRAIALQKAGEHQLVCELTDMVIAANPKDRTARIIKANSLEYLGYQSGNLNMFGFYRSAASLERQAADIKP